MTLPTEDGQPRSEKREGLLRRAFRWLLSLGRRQRPVFHFSTLTFEKCDVDGLIEQLQLRVHASENGRHEIPRTSDVQLDGPQQRVVNQIDGTVSEVLSQAKPRLASQEHRIATIDLGLDGTLIAAATDRLEHDLRELRDEYRHERGILEEEFSFAERALSSFRRAHGLDWDPGFPGSHLWHWAILATVLLFETALNGAFFAKGHELGLIGGIGRAVAIAFANVAVSCGMGRVAAYLRVNTRQWKIVGVAALIAWSVLAFTYNLSVAHLRDALATDPDHATVLALQTLYQSPFSLREFDSWILFLVGALFSAIAFADGWRWDGEYPGFARRRLRLDSARGKLIDLREEIRSKARAARDSRAKEVEAFVADARARLAALEAAVGAKDTLLENVRGFISHYEAACNALIKCYRDFNRQARTTEAPPYFQTEWSYPIPAEFRGDTNQDRLKIEALRAQVTATSGQVAKMRNELAAMLSRFEALVHETAGAAVSDSDGPQ